MDTLSPAIKIDHLNFYYDYKLPTQTYALKDIDFEIGQGEYVVFFGPSGCGKTTLIYLIGGINTNAGGTGDILVNGQDVLQLSRDDLTIFRQTGIGIIFQNFNLIPSLTILDNVALPMTFVGVPQRKRRESAYAILKRLDMESYASRYPFELSGGQQQRVGIARALANDPPIIIADEPLGNLDSENAEHVLKFLKELQEKDGRTIIMVTHEAWSVRDADKIIYLKDGGVVKTTRNTKETIASQAAAVPVSPDMFRKLYPDLSQEDIMIKSISNLLLRGFSVEEIKRFERYLSERFSDTIDAATFEAFLDLPYRKGGVGLWKQRAHKIAELTEAISSEKKKLTEVYAELKENPETPLQEEAASLREWVVREYRGHIDETSRTRLDEILIGRLRGTLSPEDFRKMATLARSRGGIGLSLHSVQHMSDRLEAVLAWGKTGDMKDAMTVISTS